jgi:chromosome segregation ATPase
MWCAKTMGLVFKAKKSSFLGFVSLFVDFVNDRTHLFSKTTTFLALILLGFNCELQSQSLSLEVIMDPSPTPIIGEWDMRPELITINTFNFTGESLDVKFIGEIRNSYGDRVGGTDQSSATVISIPPGESTFSGSELIPVSGFFYEDKYQKSIYRTAMLPEDYYMFCVDLLDAVNNQSIIEFDVCSDFNITGVEDPYLIYPYDEAVINIFDLTNIVFQWSPVFIGSSTVENLNFRFVIAEVLQGQQAEEAIRKNDLLLDECLYIDDPQFLWPEDMISLPPGKYVWSVMLVSDCKYVTIEPSQVFVFIVSESVVTDSIYTEPGDTIVELGPKEGTEAVETPPPIYGEESDACSQASFLLNKGGDISLGMVLEDPSSFKYPRAVGLRAEGIDWDNIDFLCGGCNGKVGTVSYPVEDQVAGYKWKLIGKGSLNTPPDIIAIDSLEKKLKELQAKLSKVIDSLDKASLDTTKTIPGKMDKLKTRIDDANRTKADLDSLSGKLRASIDSLNAEFRSGLSKIQRFQRKIDSLISENNEKRLKADSLEKKIKGEAAEDEKAQQTIIRQTQDEFDRIKRLVQQKQEELLIKSELLSKKIAQAETNLRAASNSYNQLKNKAEAVTAEITRLETQMMREPDTKKFMLRLKDWKRKSVNYIWQFANSQNYRDILLENRKRIQNIAFDAISLEGSSERANKYSEYLSAQNTFNNSLSNICASLQQPFYLSCNESFINLDNSSKNFSTVLINLVNSSYLLNRKQQETLDSLRKQLRSMEAALNPIKSNVAKAMREYGKSLKQYNDQMELLQNEKTALMQENEEIGTDLAKAEANLKRLVDKRLAVLDNNMGLYLAHLHTLREKIISGDKKIDSNTDSIIMAQNDTLNIGVRKTLVHSRMADTELMLGRISLMIKNLEKQLEETKKDLEKAKQKAKDLKKEKEQLEKEIEKLKSDIKKKLNPKSKKTAKGSMVYYIPPNLEEILQKPVLFDSLKKQVVVLETELNSAYRQKEALQGKLVKLIDKTSKNLVKYKLAKDKIPELEKKIAKTEDDLKKEKTEKAQEFLDEQQKIQDDLRDAVSKKDSIAQKLAEYLNDSTIIIKEIDKYKNLIKDEDSVLNSLRENLYKMMDQFDYEEKQLNNIKNKLALHYSSLTEEKSKLASIKNELLRAQNDLSRAYASDTLVEITAKKDEIKQLNSKIKIEESIKIPSIEQIIAASTKSLKSAKKRHTNALKQKEDAFKEYTKLASNLNHVLRDSLKSKNEQMEEALSGLEHQRKIEDKAQKKLDRTKKRREDTQGDIEKRLNEEEGIQSKQKSVDGLKKDLENLKKEQAKAEADIKEAIAKKDKLIKEATDTLKKAKKNLEDAKKNLRDYLKDEEFKIVNFSVKLELTADDRIYDKWRFNDKPPKKLVKTLRYPSKRIPMLVGGNTYAKNNMTVVPDTLAVCMPDYTFEIGKPPKEIKTRLIDKVEPRTIALRYKNGEPLWPEWPVIPSTASLMAKEIVRVGTVFSKDEDKLVYSCRTDAECSINPPLRDTILDIGKISWTAEGRVINQYPQHGIMLWETGYVDKPLIAKQQIIKPLCLATEIAKDDPLKALLKPMVKPGLMIETMETILGLPDTAVDINARIITGDHKGLEGEEIEFEAKLINGDSKDWGFDGAKPKTTEITKNGGYAKPKFNFGDGFAEFKISIRWKRNGKIVQEEETMAKAPIKIKLHYFGSAAPNFAWEAAGQLFEKGGSIESVVKKFPSSSDKNDKDKYASEVHGVAGLMDVEKNFMNGEKTLFKLSDKKIKTEPEEDETKLFGIGRTRMKKLPEDADVELTAKVEDKYKKLGEPPKDKKSYSTKKSKEFKIGTADNPFTVVMDEEFAPGEGVSGKGKLKAENAIANQFIREFLGEIDIRAHDIELQGDEEFVAITGTVSWVGESPIKKSFAGIEISLDSLVISASMGAGLGGSIKKDSLIPSPIKFYAELEADGNFIGKLEDLPSIGFKGFKLKEGTSFSVDMHGGKSPAPFEDSFKGVVIHAATLELPESFSKEEGEIPSLSIKDFYIGSRYKKGGQRNFNLGGEVSYEGTLLKLAYAGYDFAVNKVVIKIDDNHLKSGEFVGLLKLPIPMEGKVKTTLKASGDAFAAEIATDNPVSIPRLNTTLSLLNGTGLFWDAKKKIGTLRLNCFMVSKKFGKVEVNGIEVNSDGGIKAEEITIEKAIKFGSGFDLHVNKLSFKLQKNEYGLTFDGAFRFERIGIDKLEGVATIAPGPTASVLFKNADIKFDKGPVSFKGSFAYSGSEFKGKFDIGIKKILPNGISGLLVVGNMKDPNDVIFNYWYSELAIGTRIPLAQTGIAVFQMGGGLGYNYLPPVGKQEGSPSHNDAFSFKAIVGIGNMPNGKIFAGRMEMLLVPGMFSLYGKTWLLDQETAMFGEGLLNLQWAPVEKLDGHVRMFVGIPDANGGIMSFNGKLNFLFSADKSFIKSESISGDILKELKMNGNIDISPEKLLLSGELGYEFNKKFSLDIVSIIVDFDVKAQGVFKYDHINKSLYANQTFSGSWDVDIETPMGTGDIISGSTNLEFELKANPSFVEVNGSAKLSYDIWVYKGSKLLDFKYKSNL